MIEAHREQAMMLQAAQDILEMMFFVSPESSDVPEPWPDTLLTAELRFEGVLAGGFRIHIEEDCARAIAGNFSGAFDPAEMDSKATVGVLCELANMVCGATLSRLEPDSIFNLSSPQPVESGPPELCDGVQQWLRLDEGLIGLELYVENSA